MTIHATIPSTGCGPDGWREFWRIESRRVGSDWVSLIDCAQAVLSELRIMHVGASST